MKLLENVFKAKPILYAYYDKIELPDSEMARLLATRNLWQHAGSRSYLDLIAEARDSGKEFRYEFRCGAVLTTCLDAGVESGPGIFYITFKSPPDNDELRTAIQLELDVLRLSLSLQDKLVEFNEFAKSYTPGAQNTKPSLAADEEGDEEDDEDTDDDAPMPPFADRGRVRQIPSINIQPPRPVPFKTKTPMRKR